MIKNIYSKSTRFYTHEYYCDNCFKELECGEILRNEEAIKRNKFDLCIKCKYDWDFFEKNNKGGENE